MSSPILSAGLAMALTAGLVGAVSPAAATPVTVADPGLGWDISARARNGRNGFELSFQDPNVANRNYPGAPAWSFGNQHHFELGYNGTTGALSFSMDFNRDGSFQPLESLTYTFADRAGFGFRYVDLFLQGNATGNAKVDNMTINGTGFGTFGFTSNSVVEQVFTDTAGHFRDILITGDLTFSANGGTDERPRIWIRLGDAVSNLAIPEQLADVPEPATLAVLGFGLAGLIAVRRRGR